MIQNPILDEIIPAGEPWSAIVTEGQYLTRVQPTRLRSGRWHINGYVLIIGVGRQAWHMMNLDI